MATARSQEFVVEDRDGAVPRRVAAALEPRFTVRHEARHSARQTWLDTFDWRLHAAGLVLQQVTGGQGGELVLRTAAGEPVATAPAGTPRWPGLLAAIPPGPLRDRLEPVVGVRALLPLARAQDTQTLLRVLDGEHKTVARITLDDATLVRPTRVEAPAGAGATAAGPLPVRLLLAPVRGYQAAADRAGRLLAEAGGFTPAPRPAFADVLAAAGRRPGDYTDRVDVSLDASMPARVALARILLRLADTMQANTGFVVRDVDIEFLHDLRVAVRRTRSALKLAGDVLPGDVAACYAPEFTWLGDLTTPTRDLDVYLAGFGQMAAGLRAASPADLEPLRAYLASQRAAGRRRLVRGLRSDRFGRLMTGWRAVLEDAARPRRRDGGPDAGRLAAERIERAYRRVVKRGAALTSPPDGQPGDGPAAGDLHALRKRGKELRYLLEFFGSLYEPAAARRAVRDLKGLQDCLGEFQDGTVQREAIRGFAAVMVTRRDLPAAELAATLLAMGELTAGLDERQRRARAELAGRFAGFARAGPLPRLPRQAAAS